MAGTQDSLRGRPASGSQSDAGKGADRRSPGAAAQRAAVVALFGVLYHSGLRPEEAVSLRVQDVKIPQLGTDGNTQRDELDDLWGELHLQSASPDAGKQWTDDGTDRDHRGLKHRAEGESRTVPCPPALVTLLREHLDRFGGTADGPLFRGVQGRPIATITYRRAWNRARETALTAESYRSPLARRPYDLRHACLSTWPNGGVAPTQVAEWAGHSAEVLLRVYAKCLAGQHETAKRRISAALDQTQ